MVVTTVTDEAAASGMIIQDIVHSTKAYCLLHLLPEGIPSASKSSRQLLNTFLLASVNHSVRVEICFEGLAMKN